MKSFIILSDGTCVNMRYVTSFYRGFSLGAGGSSGMVLTVRGSSYQEVRDPDDVKKIRSYIEEHEWEKEE